jgi:hypothetical protein
MRDYHDWYLLTDTLLQADVFETYRTTILETPEYRLDPANFLIERAWACMYACNIQYVCSSDYIVESISILVAADPGSSTSAMASPVVDEAEASTGLSAFLNMELIFGASVLGASVLAFFCGGGQRKGAINSKSNQDKKTN